MEAVCAFNVAAEIETGFKRTGKLTLTGLTKPLCVGGGATVRGSFVVNTTETWFYIVLRTHVTNMATCQKIVSELSLGASESEARRGGHF